MIWVSSLLVVGERGIMSYEKVKQITKEQEWNGECMSYLATVFIMEHDLGEEYVSYLRSDRFYVKSLEVECND